MIEPPSIDHLEGVSLGTVDDIEPLVARRRAVVVTDRRLAEEPGVQSVTSVSMGAPIALECSEPTVDTVARLATAVADTPPDVVVAVGGGSVIDTAKLAAAVAASGGAVSDYVAGARPFSATLPVVAVPTTSGSGAEVSRTAVVSSPTTKTWAWDPLLRPAHVVLDPLLTASMPPAVTVSTGLDAFVHAVEAGTATRGRPDVTARAGEAAAAVRRALPVALAEPSDPDARSTMLLSSVSAGWAIDRVGTGAGHAVGHALASLAAVPHGLAVAFGMRACLDWTIAEPSARRLLARLGGSIVDDIEPLTDEIGLEELVAGFVRERIDPLRLAEELGKPEHRPMRANAARPIADGDVTTVGRLVADRWNELA